MLAPAAIEFGPEGPASLTYGDRYASRVGALVQARGVFLAGCDLPAAWRDRPHFTVLETGFGLGFNFLACWDAWRRDPGRCRHLHFLSVERHPVPIGALARAHAPHAEIAALARELRRALPPLLPGCHRITLEHGRVHLTLCYGEAATALADLEARADAVFLDGFAPDRNPAMWDEAVIAEVARLAAPGARLATWTAAGAVRRRLAARGFLTERGDGFAGKRNTTRAVRSGTPAGTHDVTGRSALVIGAGVAGCLLAAELAARDWSVQLLDAGSGPAEGASGNPAAVVRPLLSRDDNRASRLTRAAFLYAVQRWQIDRLDGQAWQPCGVLQIAHDTAQWQQWQHALEELALPGDFASLLDSEQIRRHTGGSGACGGVLFPGAGRALPAALCRAALARGEGRITTRWRSAVCSLQPVQGGWQALSAEGQVLGEAASAVIAIGAGRADGTDGADFLPRRWRPLQRLRGEITRVAAGAIGPLELVVCGDGYICPDGADTFSLGATYDRSGPGHPTSAGAAENLQRLQTLLGISAGQDGVAILGGRASWRSVAADRVPVVGADPQRDGLWHLRGLASRGVVWSPVLAELLACEMNAEPLPLPRSLRAAVATDRNVLSVRTEP